MKTSITWTLLLGLAMTACNLGSYQASDAGAQEEEIPGEPTFDPLCSACHGDETSPAPPNGLLGATSRSNRGVGAHRAHLNQGATWHKPVWCGACHMVPLDVTAPGHFDDDDNTAEVIFSSISQFRGATPSWNGTSCSGSYCHGATMRGGSNTEPSWTVTDGSQDACGSCHGLPPPEPHPAGANCGNCHPTMQGATVFRDPGSHINGVVDLGDGASCDSCHGSGGISAPPQDLDGNTARSASGVGAHRIHLGTSDWRSEIVCSNCHVVPADVGAPGHLGDDDTAELTFDGLNPMGGYDFTAATCTNLYCHGSGRSNNGTLVWTGDPQLGCNSCHADNVKGGLGGEHGEHDKQQCDDCHQSVISGNTAIVNAALHVDGQRQISIKTGGTYNPSTKSCSGLANGPCHGNEKW